MLDRKRSLALTCQGSSGKQLKLTSFPQLPQAEPSKDQHPGADDHKITCATSGTKCSPWKDLGKGGLVGYWPRVLSKAQHDHAFQVRRTSALDHFTTKKITSSLLGLCTVPCIDCAFGRVHTSCLSWWTTHSPHGLEMRHLNPFKDILCDSCSDCRGGAKLRNT